MPGRSFRAEIWFVSEDGGGACSDLRGQLAAPPYWRLAFGQARQSMTYAYPLDGAWTWRVGAAAPLHRIRTPGGMTLAESNYLRFAVGSDAIMRSSWSPPPVSKGLTNGGERAAAEFI